MQVNPCKEKKASNVRTVMADDKISLGAPRLMSLEDAIGCVWGARDGGRLYGTGCGWGWGPAGAAARLYGRLHLYHNLNVVVVGSGAWSS